MDDEAKRRIRRWRRPGTLLGGRKVMARAQPATRYLDNQQQDHRPQGRGDNSADNTSLADEPLYQIDNQQQDHRPQGRRDNSADNASAQG